MYTPCTHTLNLNTLEILSRQIIETRLGINYTIVDYDALPQFMLLKQVEN